jgi:hypothetical protein
MSFHQHLIELESELIAKQEIERELSDELAFECSLILDAIEQEIGIRLGDKVQPNWSGWIAYRRKNSTIICRGRSFAQSGLRKSYRVGWDIPGGESSISDCMRGHDVSPPQEIDHLLLSFGGSPELKISLWYGENIAPYRLVCQLPASLDSLEELKTLIVEACTWILRKPKGMTINQFIKSIYKK